MNTTRQAETTPRPWHRPSFATPRGRGLATLRARAVRGPSGAWPVALWLLAALALGALAGCRDDVAETLQPAPAADAARHPVTTRPRAGGPGAGLLTTVKGHDGELVRAPCSSCHSTRDNVPGRDGGDVPTDFHAGLTMRHGTLRCGQCHAAPEANGGFDYDALHLSDGSKVAVDAAITLCAQCHGPQTRDYKHGSHGGMQGHWDTRLGPRERNQCIHCHDPHAPAYVGMVPAPGPRDRFLQHRSAAPGEGGH